MNIYFAGSIRGGRDDKELYQKIITLLFEYGSVLTEHVADQGVLIKGEEGLSDQDIYDRDMAWLRQADVVVAEVTTPSLGVGYEIAKAEELGKKTLCLFRNEGDKQLSAMIAGSDNVITKSYNTLEDVEKIICGFFAE